MIYVYTITYYRYSSIFCYYEYENEIFSSEKKAKIFLKKIVEEEERCADDSDFKEWKIKLQKRILDNENNNFETIEHIYDLSGALIYSSSDPITQDKIFTEKYKIGDIVEIFPFPWKPLSPIETSKQGIIAGHNNSQYTVYTIDCCKVTHLHINESSLGYLENKNMSHSINTLKNIIIRYKGKISDENIVASITYKLGI